ncbi:Molybdopterin-guanine dinucleotide biosynthesis protein A [Micromonospora citrea]|uniref:Molybdopterin-guanine dinucleotide biosynthesis protein A n=1 Tax=Micromonospora citrea TaxID=47855 RepID=A0A1C6V3M3_9ACTN|nr:Molybdopterin-guanine dinucleotide biosynthesis protein A [Micromonospora citrea]
MDAYAAVVLAGGAARRMGGLDKPARPVGGRPMRDRVLAAVADAASRVVVGPPAAVPAGVRVTREEPPGGGPVAAVAAGLALVDAGTPVVALLAADLPLLTRAAVGVLLDRLDAGHDGACFVDDEGRRQTLCGVWRAAPLRAALARLAAGLAAGGKAVERAERAAPGKAVERAGLADGGKAGGRGGAAPLAGTSIRALLAGLRVREVPWTGAGPPPWFDCDTDEDVRRAEEWAR